MRFSAARRPPGWELNPSSVSQRAVCVTVGLAGLAAAIACTLHEAGFVDRLWEPLPVITSGGRILSPVAALYPLLDVVALTLTIVTIMLGGVERWKTRPALVFATGAIAFVGALSAVTRWTWQYLSLGTTSTLFFVTVACEVALLPLLADEVYAAAFGAGWPSRARRSDDEDEGWPGYLAGAGGVALGLYLLAAPAIGRGAFQHGHLLGGFIAAIGAVALSQAGRPARWLNAILGAWLVVAPLVLGFSLRGHIHLLLVGLLLITCSVALSSSESPRTRGLRHVG